MTELLKGAPIIDQMRACCLERALRLSAAGRTPTLCVIRVGARADDLAYENTIRGAAAKVGVGLRVTELAEDVPQPLLMDAIRFANGDESVHGILMFRPLPGHLDETVAADAIAADKDIDGASSSSMARLYASKHLSALERGKGKEHGGSGGARFFLPCTAESVMKILFHYGVPIEGKRAVVIGRSTVIGKPVALLLLAENATVTIAHSKSEDLPEICRGADILVVCAGVTARGTGGKPRGGIGREYLSARQTVVDVGIHADDDGKLFGDVDAEAANGLAAALTPVPGGVGGVTTQVLLSHVIDAAEQIT